MDLEKREKARIKNSQEKYAQISSGGKVIEKHNGGRPKKIYTPEELAAKEERQRRRLEKTVENRSAAFVQPWCSTPLKFRHKVEEYFDTGAKSYKVKFGEVELEQKLYTWSGLAYYLGFSSRESLNTFGKKHEFKEIVERAKLVVEQVYEERLHSNTPSGAIFALKNFGWTDVSNTNLNITVNPLEKLIKNASRIENTKNINIKANE